MREVKAVLYTMLFHIIHNIGSTSSGSHLRKLLHFGISCFEKKARMLQMIYGACSGLPQFLLILGSVSHGFAVTAYASLRLTPQSPQVTHKPQSIEVVLFL